MTLIFFKYNRFRSLILLGVYSMVLFLIVIELKANPQINYTVSNIKFDNPVNLSSNLSQEDIKVPELLTPNGDGKNDTWKIIGIESFNKTKVTIFNRWGNKVYEMEQYDNSWEGKANRSGVVGDSKLPAGTYYYIVELDDKTLKGYLFLAR